MRSQGLSHPLPFLRGWSRNPVAVGLPFPSSSWTASRLARTALAAALPDAGPVVELGAGTGSVTQALIDAGCPAREIVAVERDAELCCWLQGRFPDLRVIHGDALHLGKAMVAAGIYSVRIVLSGLPMRAIPPREASRCYSDAFRLMPLGGAIIQYTYGFRPPVNPAAAMPSLEATFIAREWRNVPPMAIWRYRERQSAVRTASKYRRKSRVTSS
jgi:phosphatidylethanolamine/phosphatidyl-N-methylethanolamine N-methyltransferase